MSVYYLPFILLIEFIIITLFKFYFNISFNEVFFYTLIVILFIIVYIKKISLYKREILLYVIIILLFLSYPFYGKIVNIEKNIPFRSKALLLSPFYNNKAFIHCEGINMLLYSKNIKEKLEIGDSIYINGVIFKRKLSDYDMYLYRNGYPFTVYAYFVKPLKHKDESLILSIKRYIYQKIDKANLSDNAKGIFLALILGDRHYIDEDIKNSFINSGTIHLLAISGLHIGIISVILWYIFYFFPPVYRRIIVLSILFFYVFFIVQKPSAMRAFMVLVYLWGAYFLQTDSDHLRGLSIIALFLLILNPFYLYDRGFIYSFFAYSGIIISMHIWKDKQIVLKMILISLFAQLPLIPLLIYHNGFVNLFSLLHNIFLIPLMYPLIFLIILSFVFPFVYPFADTYIKYYTGYIKTISNYGVIHLPYLGILITLAFYLFFLAIVMRKNKKLFILFGLLLWCISVWTGLFENDKIIKNYFDNILIRKYCNYIVVVNKDYNSNWAEKEINKLKTFHKVLYVRY